ncbi:MAG: hypothetical protein OEZ02_06735 [Anaerolineae bacterium]|nr:hypothetical protein [Anaerolineae bacterium]
MQQFRVLAGMTQDYVVKDLYGIKIYKKELATIVMTMDPDVYLTIGNFGARSLACVNKAKNIQACNYLGNIILPK